jgi:hypothetical protein
MALHPSPTKRHRFALAALVALVVLTGCQSFGGTTGGGVKPPDAPKPDTIEDLLSGTYDSAKRNRWIEARLVDTDDDYYALEADLQDSRTNIAVGTKIARLVFGVASSLTPSAGVKANYAAATVLTDGAMSIADKEYFMEQSVSALVAAMRARRAEVFGRIRVGMTRGLDNYTLADANRDLHEYRRAGTVVQGMSFVTAAAQKSEAEADSATRNAVEAAVRYEPNERQVVFCNSQTLDDLVKRRNAGQRQSLRDALKAAGAPDDVTKASDDDLDARITGWRFNAPAEQEQRFKEELSSRGLLLTNCREY